MREYLNRIVLQPRRGKYDKNTKLAAKEATKERLSAADAKFQNTTKTVIRIILFYLALPKGESGISLVSVSKEMQTFNAYQTLRKEWKQQKGVYKRIEKAKSKAKEAQGKGKK